MNELSIFLFEFFFGAYLFMRSDWDPPLDAFVSLCAAMVASFPGSTRLWRFIWIASFLNPYAFHVVAESMFLRGSRAHEAGRLGKAFGILFAGICLDLRLHLAAYIFSAFVLARELKPRVLRLRLDVHPSAAAKTCLSLRARSGAYTWRFISGLRCFGFENEWAEVFGSVALAVLSLESQNQKTFHVPTVVLALGLFCTTERDALSHFLGVCFSQWTPPLATPIALVLKLVLNSIRPLNLYLPSSFAEAKTFCSAAPSR